MRCPRSGCVYERGSQLRFYVKRGYYRTKYNGGQPVPRYRCLGCGKGFSSHTFRPTYRQKKPHLNKPIEKWYCSAVTQRRMAILLGVNRKTIARKFEFLALEAKAQHGKWLKGFPVTHVQFDESESFEHTRLKPLSVALAVSSCGKILDAQVGILPYKGPLASLAFQKYGPREGTDKKVRGNVLRGLSGRGLVTLTTDHHPSYKSAVARALPQVQHIAVHASRSHPVKSLARRRRNHQDPLFAVNHVAAKIRHDLSRMARRVWTTTKCHRRLQKHLDLYAHFHNQNLVRS